MLQGSTDTSIFFKKTIISNVWFYQCYQFYQFINLCACKGNKTHITTATTTKKTCNILEERTLYWHKIGDFLINFSDENNLFSLLYFSHGKREGTYSLFCASYIHQQQNISTFWHFFGTIMFGVKR